MRLRLLLVLFPLSFTSVARTDSGSCNVFPEALRITSKLKSIASNYKLPGMSFSYANNRHFSQTFVVGLADKEKREPIVKDSKMLAASIGKTFVGPAILMLEHEGVLDRQDKINKYLSDKQWFSRMTYGNDITVEDLLLHTSGLPDYVDNPDFQDAFRKRWAEREKQTFDVDELIEFALRESQGFPPRTQWHYADVNYLMLGQIIEGVTKKPYSSLIMRLFVNSLKLSNTSVVTGYKMDNLAVGYVSPNNVFGLPEKTGHQVGELLWNPSFEFTGGGLASTSGDLARWGAALFGSEALSFNYMHDLIGQNSDFSKAHYGFGVAISESSQFGTMYGHSGWIPGYVSSLKYYKRFKVAIAFQTNVDVPFLNEPSLLNELERQLAELLFESCAV